MGTLTHASASSLGTIIYGTLPPAGTPTKRRHDHAGPADRPDADVHLPDRPGREHVDRHDLAVATLFMPLYAGPTGAMPEVNEALSAANPPMFSNGDKTVTITIKPGLKWSNGAPIDANDVVFEFDLLQAAVKESPANWGQYTPGV